MCADIPGAAFSGQSLSVGYMIIIKAMKFGGTQTNKDKKTQ